MDRVYTDKITGSSWIDDPLVQNSLIDLLRRTERENGWPYRYMERQVTQAWRRM